MKRYNMVDIYIQRCYTMQNNTYIREKESKAQEYAVIFQIKEKDFQLAESQPFQNGGPT